MWAKCQLSAAKGEGEGRDGANDEPPSSRSLSLFLLTCQNQISLFWLFPPFTLLSLLFSPPSLSYLPIWVSASIPDPLFFCFCFPGSSPSSCLIVAERGYLEQMGSRIDIQIILLREIREAIVSHPWCVNCCNSPLLSPSNLACTKQIPDWLWISRRVFRSISDFCAGTLEQHF